MAQIPIGPEKPVFMNNKFLVDPALPMPWGPRRLLLLILSRVCARAPSPSAESDGTTAQSQAQGVMARAQAQLWAGIVGT